MITFKKGKKMRLIKKLMCSVVFIVTLIFFSGCTAIVRPTISQSEFLTNEEKVPATVVLHITQEFINYTYKHFDWVSDAKNYAIKVGPLTSDWLRYALESKINTVLIKSGKPQFTESSSNVDLLITPRFTSFKAGGPLPVKFEQYWVDIGMEVTLQDSQGRILETLKLQQKGSKAGSIGLESGTQIYPEVCRMAIKPMVDKTVDKVIELVTQN